MGMLFNERIIGGASRFKSTIYFLCEWNKNNVIFLFCKMFSYLERLQKSFLK